MKFLKSTILLVAFLGVGFNASAAPVKRLFQDVKLPTQKVIEVQSWAGPQASDTIIVYNNAAGPTSAAAFSLSASSLASQPDFARNLVITAGGSAVDLGSCVVTVAGTSYNDHSISETLTFSSATLGAQTGSKAFKTVTSVSWPANCESGSFATKWSIGFGTKFGLKRCMANAGDVFKELLDGSAATAGTPAQSSSAVESNTNIFNTAPNGTHNYVMYFLQNYLCF